MKPTKMGFRCFCFIHPIGQKVLISEPTEYRRDTDFFPGPGRDLLARNCADSDMG